MILGLFFLNSRVRWFLLNGVGWGTPRQSPHTIEQQRMDCQSGLAKDAVRLGSMEQSLYRKWRYGTCFCKSYVFIVRTIVTIPNTSMLEVLLVLQYMFCCIWYFHCMPTHCILHSCGTTPLVTFTAVFCPRTSQCDLSPRTTCVVCLSETHPSL